MSRTGRSGISRSAGGSYLAAFCQGAALGAFIDGFNVHRRVLRRRRARLADAVQRVHRRCRDRRLRAAGQHLADDEDRGSAAGPDDRAARRIVPVLLVGIVIVSLWTPLAHRDIAARWFSLPDIFFFAPVPILVVADMLAVDAAADRRGRRRVPQAGPFLLALFLLFLGYSGLAISLWPNIIPPGVSFRDAAAPPQSQGFALVGALLIIPIILTYTGWAYYVFRGKVTDARGLPLMWAPPRAVDGGDLGRQRPGFGDRGAGHARVDEPGRTDGMTPPGWVPIFSPREI